MNDWAKASRGVWAGETPVFCGRPIHRSVGYQDIDTSSLEMPGFLPSRRIMVSLQSRKVGEAAPGVYKSGKQLLYCSGEDFLPCAI